MRLGREPAVRELVRATGVGNDRMSKVGLAPIALHGASGWDHLGLHDGAPIGEIPLVLAA